MNMYVHHGTPFVTVPSGSIVEIREEIGKPGLIQIQLNNQPPFAFTRDIIERADPVDEPARLKGLIGRG